MASGLARFQARFLALCLGVFLSAGFGGSLQAQWVTAYYAGWQQGYLPATSVDYSAVTHICHFALIPNANGSIDDQGNSVNATNAASVISAAHAAGKKVLITVGGWNTESAFMSATGSGTRATFVSNLVTLMHSRGYDGIDIDWEPLNSGDAANYTAFVTDLRNAMNAISPRPMLTMATGWSAAISASVASQMDQINLMTYDISGPWPGWVTWHNSATVSGGQKIGTQLISADDFVNTWSGAGVPLAKLGIGIDFYGYVWSGGSGTTTGGATAPAQSWTTAPSVQGNVPYYSIMSTYYQPANYRWDATAQAAYLSFDNTGSANDKFISYDDESTCAAKINYTRTKGIGGVIIWELGGGYRATMPAGQRDLLLQAIKQAVGGTPTPDTTPPAVSLSSPSNGSTVSNTVSVSANASDNVGVAGVQFQLNGSNLGSEVTLPPYTYSWNTASSANGPVTIAAVARDAAGNRSTSSVSVTVSNSTPDATPPAVSLTSPANGATVSGTVSVSANASDNVGVVGVQFQLNGANLGAEVTSAPYSYSWNTTTGANGSSTIAAVARDAAGNRSTSSVTVTVSNAAPPTTTYTTVASDNFNRPDQSPVAGGHWGTLLNQPGSGTIQLVGNAIQPYNSLGSGNAGGIVWDSLLSNGSGACLTIAQKAENGVNSALFIYLRMNTKDLSTGNGYRLRYVDNPSAPDYLAIEEVTNGTTGTGLVSVNREINIGDTLKFIARNDPSGTLEGYVNGTLVLSVADVTFNPSGWYAWVRGFVLPTIPRYDNFAIVSSTAPAAPPVPPAPVLVSPASGASGVATSPTLSWNAASGAASYEAQLSTSSSFGSTVLNTRGITGTSVSATGLLAGTSYYWRVNATNAAGTGGWSAVSSFTTAAAPPVSSDQWLYQDALQSPWINGSSNATVTFNSTEQVLAGTYSIKVVEGKRGSLSLHSGTTGIGAIPVNPAQYQSVEFSVNGGPYGASIAVMLGNDLGNTFPQISVGSVPANTWRTFTVPISQLDPGNYMVHRLDITEVSRHSRTYYVDNIRFAAPATIVSQNTPGGLQSAAEQFLLAQNYPNPFNPTTSISYALPADAHVKIEVYNTIGQKVATLVNEVEGAGTHQAMFDASAFPSGIYFYRLTARGMSGEPGGEIVQTKRMILAK
jgi:chitinase